MVANAFKTGKFLSFGKGTYGDLAATIASILLDREARNVLLDNDPSSGLLREPLLKFIALLRSMHFVTNEPVIRLGSMMSAIGQMAHGFQSVFSFFLPEFKLPSSRVGNATLVSPEAMLLDTPKSINLMNGLLSLVKHGLSYCDGGFALAPPQASQIECDEGKIHESVQGILEFHGDSNDVVDELATLLTAGRLDARSRQIIRDAYDSSDDVAEGLRRAQQLLLSTPAFHTTNTARQTDETRSDKLDFPPLNDKPYKAVVMIMFKGGCDSFNLLAPYSCTEGANDLYDQYVQIRQNVGLTRQRLVPISASGQVCEKFGVHEALPIVKSLYDDGDLLFFANTGVLTRPVTKQNYKDLTNIQLFAHNTMQRETKRVNPQIKNVDTGVLGRILDALARQGRNTQSFAIDGNDVSVVGFDGGPTPITVGLDGFSQLHISDSLLKIISRLNNKTMVDSGVYAEAWSSNLINSFALNRRMNDVWATVSKMDFPDTNLGKKLEIVSQLIQTRRDRGTDTDIFYVEFGAFDTHKDAAENLNVLFQEVNDAIFAFQEGLKSNGLWNNVTTIEVSDFGRTLTPNGSE